MFKFFFEITEPTKDKVHVGPPRDRGKIYSNDSAHFFLILILSAPGGGGGGGGLLAGILPQIWPGSAWL